MRGTDPREWTFIATLFPGATVFAFNCVCGRQRVRCQPCAATMPSTTVGLLGLNFTSSNRIISASRVLEHAARGAFAVSNEAFGCGRALTFTVAPCN